MTQLRPAARGYIAAVALLAAAVVAAAAAWTWHGDQPWEPIAVLVPIYLVALALPARLATGVLLSAHVPILIAAYLIGGWQAAALVAASGVLLRHGQAWSKHLFNNAQYALIGVVGGLTYQAMGGVAVVDLVAKGSFTPAVLPVVAVSAIAVIVANLALMLPILKLAENISPRSVWRSMVFTSAVPYFAYALFGLLMAVLWTIGGGFAASLILIPLLVARWGFQQYAEQRAAYEATISSLVQAVETKDHYTRGHSERVADASVRIAAVIGMRDDRIKTLSYAGILHDVGKLGVPTRILQKTGMLDDAEYLAIQRHPEFATEIVRGIDFLAEAHAGILHHHERLDGLGYPMGLKGEEIPEFARIIAVADAFDSMTSTRYYRGARSVDEAVEELRRCQGTQFDRRMVAALVFSLEQRPWRAVQPEDVRQLDPSVGDVVVEGFDHDDPTVPHPLGHDPAAAESAAAAEAAEEAALQGGEEWS
jgi:HD domain